MLQLVTDGDRDVRWIILMLAIFSLTACDNPSQNQPEKKSVASMIATGTEEKTFDCSKGDVSLNCEILAGDQLGSGKWHHAQLFISKSGQVDIIIDGENFYQSGANSGFYAGTQQGTFKFKGVNKSTAEVTISRGNDSSSISIAAWNKDGKQFMTTSN